MTAYSNSRISTFFQCPFRYKLRYIDRIRVKKDTIEAFMGSRVHEALEKLYKDLKYGKMNTKEDVLKFYEKRWEEKWHDKVEVIRKEYTAENYKEMGRKYISDYYDHYKPFNHLKTIGLETEKFLDLGNGDKYHIRIDRLACDDEGNYYVCDYKTGGRLPCQSDLERDKQLAMYSLWVRKNFPDAKDVKLVWHYLAFDKKLTVEKDMGQLKKVKREVLNLIRQIENAVQYPASKSSLCRWCRYRKYCPHFKHEFELEEMGEKAKEEDGVKLVDEYAKLDEKEKEIREKKNEIKDRIIEYAKQNKIESVFGTENQANLRSYSKIQYPKTKQFIKLLKKKGIYEDVIAINSSKLRKMLENGDMDIEILVNLKAEKVWSVRLAKKKD